MTESDPPFVEDGQPIRLDALRNLSDDQLERAIARSSHTVGGSDLLAEYHEREAARQTRIIRRWTIVVGILTVIIAAATIVDLAVFVWGFLNLR